MLRDDKLLEIAKKYQRTPAQMMIRWSIQTGVIPIPKSQRLERIAENAEVFDFVISAKDMEMMNSWHENLHTDWDPSDVR